MNDDVTVNQDALRIMFERSGAQVRPEEFTFRVTARNDGELLYWTNEFIRHMSIVFGGASLNTGEGGWIDNDGVEHYEPSNVLSVSCGDAAWAFQAMLPQLLEWLKETGEKAVYLKINNVAYIATYEQLNEVYDRIETHIFMNLVFGKEFGYAEE